ncbi:hypothetical protein D3C75_992710 [compost metagenome]
MPLHFGYPLQPQNGLPLFSPRLAVRKIMGLPHLGHAGTAWTVSIVPGSAVRLPWSTEDVLRATDFMGAMPWRALSRATCCL